MHTVLIVDDDPQALNALAETVARIGAEALTACSGTEAIERLKRTPRIDAIILDLVMPEMDGMAVLEAMRREAITVPVIVQTHSGEDAVTSAMRMGAADFIVKPAGLQRVATALRNSIARFELAAALKTDQARQAHRLSFDDLVAQSPAMDRVLALGRKAAASTLPVLIEGEAGSGKKALARAIHGTGPRAGKPFIALDCSAIAPQDLEALLFGTGRGGRSGKIQDAQSGTLFLGGIDALSPSLQERLLEFLKTGEMTPKGAARPVKNNVRVIAASKTRLLNLARAGQFREDLYYRLNVMPVYLPPLRARKEDIAALAAKALARFAAEDGRGPHRLSPEALALLTAYDWPGNLRQLEQALLDALALAQDVLLAPADFPALLAAREGRPARIAAARERFSALSAVHIDNAPIRLHKAPPTPEPQAADRFLDAAGNLLPLADIERAAIVFAIERNEGRMAHVARQLGIGRSTLYRKLKDYGLETAGARDVA